MPKTNYTVNISITDKDGEDEAEIKIQMSPLPTDLEAASSTSPALQFLNEFLQLVANGGEASGTIRAIKSSTGQVICEAPLSTIAK